MKNIYKDSLGQNVEIKIEEGYCILFVQDEVKQSAEICIPIKDMVNIAEQIINECE